MNDVSMWAIFFKTKTTPNANDAYSGIQGSTTKVTKKPSGQFLGLIVVSH
jgi:hypothetical protein